MSEELLVRHCSPTLAGLKTANMFTCAFESEAAMREHLRKLNRMFVKKGLCAIPLRYRKGKALIYVFRPDRLREDLCDREACAILRRQGYADAAAMPCLNRLIRRMHDTGDIPHEIGLFLGYPPEDVIGFMENRPACACPGPWKVYGDEEKARQRFDQFKACTRHYRERLAKGHTIDQLVTNAIKQ